MQVQGLVRKRDHFWSVTLFLVNGQAEPKKLRDTAWLFQPELVVESPDGRPVFQSHAHQKDPGKTDPVTFAEEQEMAMLYRHQVEFGVGHGVSIHADCPEGVCDQAHRLSTVVVPTYEVPRTTPPTVADWPKLAGLVVDMKELGETPTAELGDEAAALARPPMRRGSRTGRRTSQKPDMALYQTPGQTALERCREALRRIEAGLTLLLEDENAAEAFRFANLAMWQQRVHTIISLKKRRDEPVDERAIDVPANRSWYPFQLAFILLNLPGITKLDHNDRSDAAEAVADLLWFPTGGGKTEAYLGLSAYTMGLRRLQGPVAGRSGRAGRRRADAVHAAAADHPAVPAGHRPDLCLRGHPARRREEVGQGAVPHRPLGRPEDDAEHDRPGRRGDPAGARRQVQGAGQRLAGPIDQLPVVRGEDRARPGHQGRELRQGPLPHGLLLRRRARPLPVQRQELAAGGHPGLGRGRGDLPPPADAADRHGGQVRPDAVERQGADALRPGRWLLRPPRVPFARDRRRRLAIPRRTSTPRPRRRRHPLLRPPDLIIQDELHLISGPLGTLVGLYETAVDKLCSWEVNGKTVRPKLIASTATIRKAGDQIHATFLREVRVFPPNGLDVRDNFFALQRPPERGHARSPLHRHLRPRPQAQGRPDPGLRRPALRRPRPLREEGLRQGRRPVDDADRLLQLDAGTGRHAAAGGRRRADPPEEDGPARADRRGCSTRSTN